jgi:SAM-dependent methyltransferase
MAYQHYFSRKVWEGYSDSLSELKYNELLKLIPADTTEILDIGCGDGRVTNRLGEKWRVCGVDFSPVALEGVQTEKICASCDALPVEDNSFDMVLSSEMLEHLDDTVLRKTVNEFKRVAKRYILVSVPSRETLLRRLVKCPKCKKTFHAHGHVQSFSEADLGALFGPEFTPLKEFIGGPPTREGNAWLVRIKHNLADYWFDPGAWRQCPHCGNETFPKQRNSLLSKTLNLADRFLSPSRPYWLYMLLERKKG